METTKASGALGHRRWPAGRDGHGVRRARARTV